MRDDEQENGIFQEDRRLVGAGGGDEQENGISQEDRRLVGAGGGHLNLGTKTIHPVKYNILFSPNQA